MLLNFLRKKIKHEQCLQTPPNWTENKIELRMKNLFVLTTKAPESWKALLILPGGLLL